MEKWKTKNFITKWNNNEKKTRKMKNIEINMRKIFLLIIVSFVKQRKDSNCPNDNDDDKINKIYSFFFRLISINQRKTGKKI